MSVDSSEPDGVGPAGGAQPRSVLIVRNPRARAPSERVLFAAAAPLRAAGWLVELHTTAYAGEATTVARQAADGGVDIVVACGGDGTVREVVSGLAGSDTALGTIAAGTANVWAREIHLPRVPAAALAVLPWARAVRIDVGVANGRHFLLMCSVGLDAETVRQVGAGGAKRWLGRGAYALAGARNALRARPVAARIVVGEQTLERDLLMAVAGNTRLYGGAVRITRYARVDDGLLDLCAFSGGGLLHRARLAARVVRGDLERDATDGVDYLRAAAIEIETERPMAVQVDGEFAGETPLHLAVLPAALTVLMAPCPNALLGE